MLRHEPCFASSLLLMVQVERVEQKLTLLVTREIEEHANVFHTMTDLLNVYITLRMLGWDLRAPRQVILLDSHPRGALDGLWPAIAAGGGASFLDGPAEGKSSGAISRQSFDCRYLLICVRLSPASSFSDARCNETRSCQNVSKGKRCS